MYQNYAQILQWLQNSVQAQEQRIIGLEKLIQQLSEELKRIKEKPTIHVDTIEYKFDQLKVETLEGTLNIGLNPSDMQGIEDLAVNQPANIPPDPKGQMQRSIEIENVLLSYLETDLPKIIQEAGSRLNIQSNDSYLTFIKDDIRKQLPTRIDYHLKSSNIQDQSEESMKISNQNIIEQIKKEIQNGVAAFLNHLPENVKEMSQNDL
jgi:spore germination protein PC